LPVIFATRAAQGYIDLAPTLTKIVGDSPTIAVVEVTAYDRNQHVVTFKPVQTLKGTIATDTIAHEVAPVGGTAPRQIVQWAGAGEPGGDVPVAQRHAGHGADMPGHGWYQVNSVGTGPWKLGAERPDLPLAYYGSLTRLLEGVQAILKGQGAVITVVAFGRTARGRVLIWR